MMTRSCSSISCHDGSSRRERAFKGNSRVSVAYPRLDRRTRQNVEGANVDEGIVLDGRAIDFDAVLGIRDLYILNVVEGQCAKQRD